MKSQSLKTQIVDYIRQYKEETKDQYQDEGILYLVLDTVLGMAEEYEEEKYEGNRSTLEQMRDKIEAFRLECAVAEYTDTDEAWHLLSEISQALRQIAQSTEADDRPTLPGKNGLVKAGDFDITNGDYFASTVGEFVQILIDLHDEAIIFRVDQDYTALGAQSAFVRKWEVWSVPQGAVREVIGWTKCQYAQKTLAEALQRGVVR